MANSVKACRTLLGRQPARTLLVDLGSPFYSDVGHDLCDALENFFSIACNLSGPCRIPFFSILALTSSPEIILPLSYVRNNQSRIVSGISDLRKLINHTSFSHKQSGCIGLGLQEACCQYSRQVQSAFQNGGFCHQVEVVIATCQNPVVIQKQVETLITYLDLEHLKRIQILPLAGLSYLPSNDTDFIMNSQSSSMTSASSNENISGMVELVRLEPDLLCLQNFFNGWLLDTGTDHEHLHIILPSPAPGEPVLTVKCDLHETVLNPAQLPHYNQFTVHADSAAVTMVFPSTSKALGMTIPVYCLHVTSRIPLSALCDSIVYGMPVIVQPTQCWKIDWEDLEKNQQFFAAICQSLLKKDEVMLAELQSEGSSKRLAGTRNQYEQLPTGQFVLIPAPNCSLLVKSVAVKELLLPCPSVSMNDEPTEECINTVETSLEKVEVQETYNPLFQTSNLYSSLRSQVSKTSTKRQQKSTAAGLQLTPSAGGDARAGSGGRQQKKADRPTKRRLHNPYEDFVDLTESFNPDIHAQVNTNKGMASHNQVTCHSGKRSRVKPVLSFPTSL